MGIRYEEVETKKLIPNARNSRKHSREQVAQIAASIARYGFLQPIVITEDNVILSGHGRFLAAQKLNLEKVRCIRESHLSDTERNAYGITDNKTAENAGWDMGILSGELNDFAGMGYNMELFGFNGKELKQILDASKKVKQDDFDVDAELSKPCFSMSGDIWYLGRHTVICGDSTLQDTYKKLLKDTRVNLVLTDPPYMVNLENASGKIANDNLEGSEAYEFLLKVCRCFHDVMAKDASIYEFYGSSQSRIFYDAFEDAGFAVGTMLIWKKPRANLTRTDWKFNFEPVIWGRRADGAGTWFGGVGQRAVMEFDGIKKSKEDGFGHPSSKPVPLIAHMIELATQTGGIVLDGFLGSASTLIACEQTDRVCYGVELEPKFVDVAVERFRATNPTAEISVERDGRTLLYNEVPKPEVSDEG